MVKGYCQEPSFSKCLAMCIKYAMHKGIPYSQANNECMRKCWDRWCIEVIE